MQKRKELETAEEKAIAMSDVAAKLDDGSGVEIELQSISSKGVLLGSSVFTSKNADIEFESENKPNIKVEISSTAQENDRLLHSLL